MRLAFFSDVHGNLGAFDIACAVMEDVGAERRFFLGDAIGYFDAIEVPRRLDEEGIESIQGNHEAMLLSGEVSAEKDRSYRLLRHRENHELFGRVGRWPTQRALLVDGIACTLVHGHPKDPVFGYAYEDRLVVSEFPEGLTVLGATHRPFVRREGNKTILNAGSVGYPRDHGTWGSLALFDTQTRQSTIVRFDISESLARIESTHPDLDPKVLETFRRRVPEDRLVGIRWSQA